MARGFIHRRDRYEAVFDRDERRILLDLLEQTRDLLAPDRELTGDPFTDLVAGLDEQFAAPNSGAAPDPDRPEDRAGSAGSTGSADDPALRRLLPDAHRGDQQVAAEFRRLTEQDLRRVKASNLDVAIAALSAADSAAAGQGSRRARSAGLTVSLERGQAVAVMAALNDVRLILGERLDLRDEDDIDRRSAAAEAAPQSELAYALALFEFLGWLQETLVGALSRGRG